MSNYNKELNDKAWELYSKCYEDLGSRQQVKVRRKLIDKMGLSVIKKSPYVI